MASISSTTRLAPICCQGLSAFSTARLGHSDERSQRMRPTRSGRPSLLFFLPLLSIIALLAILAQGCGSRAGPGATPTQATEGYVARIAALNGSGVSGSVELQVTGAALTVSIDVTGLEPDRRHF